ncbi:MAG: epoxyqueuosine reductase QueH [bacterium]
MKRQKQQNESQLAKYQGGLFIFTKLLIILAWCLLIMVIMTEPLAVPQDLEPKFTLYDKVIHIFMFGGLTLAWLIFWQEFKWFSLKRGAVLSVGFSLIFAYLLEYIQQFIPGRMTNTWDFIFGLAGMFLAVLLYHIYLYQPKPKVLLHICCATCGAYVSQLLGQDYRVHLFYSNDNIAPRKEFDKRLAEVKRISKKFCLPLTVGGYNHKAWLKTVRGHESDKEKGKRCQICYDYRLNRAAKQAKKLGIKYFASTLSVSPHKLVNIINDCGQQAGKKYGIEFLVRDFKKQDGFKKSMTLAKKFNFYRQDYCGCEFSLRDSKNKK